ncbi:hypothetical protein NQZ68_005075 [Dissostichus eleginoides]|nr:hypothetical protein NQZ68_005075 [Dissostichus eleginoides]
MCTPKPRVAPESIPTAAWASDSMLPGVTWPPGSEVLVGAVEHRHPLSRDSLLALAFLLLSPCLSPAFSLLPPSRSCHNICSVRVLEGSMTSVSRLSQSDRLDDPNILVQPIRTSKCVLVQRGL